MADPRFGFRTVSGTERTPSLPAEPDTRTPLIAVTGPGQVGKAMVLGRLGRNPALAGTVILAVDQSRFSADQPAADEAVLPSGGGCVCCIVQGDLQRTLRALLPKARRGDVSHVIVDASARSDPMSILATVITDPVIAAVYRIGGVVAIVDGPDDVATPEAGRQLMVADRIVVTEGAVALNAVRSLNPVALIAGGVPSPSFILEENRFAPTAAGQARQGSVVEVTVPDPLAWAAFSRWLSAELASGRGHGLLRVTGVVRLAGESRPVAIDAVRHHLAPPRLLSAWPAGEPPHSRLVFAGDGLDAASIQAALAGLGD